MKPLSERRRRSARELFSQCAFRYAAEYIHDVDMSSDVTRRGDCFHAARELYIRALWKARESDNHDLAMQALHDATVAHPLPLPYYLDVCDLWARWTERFSLPLDQFYDVETLNLECFGTKIRYDLVLVPSPDVLQIRDAKTHWSVPTQSAVENSYQSNFYLAVARKLFPGFHDYEMVYEYVRYGVELTVRKDAGELDLIEAQIAASDEAMAEAERTNAFPARGGSHCSVCTLTNCPVVNSAKHNDVRVDDFGDMVTTTISELAALDRAYALRRDALSAYAKEHGTLRAGGIEWAHRPNERTQYPAKEVAELLATVDGGLTLQVSSSAVKPILTAKKKYAAIQEQVKALGVTRAYGTVFDSRVVGNADDAVEAQE